jgi:hypothetical protein
MYLHPTQAGTLMTVTRAIAATAMLAGLAIGAASTAWAAPTMNGHYLATTTSPQGQSVKDDWYVSPCGDGCASVVMPNRATFQAQLVSGHWTMDTTADAACFDGTRVHSAYSTHYTWDPNTLAGTVTTTNKVPACGDPAGNNSTYTIQLRQAA